MDITSETCPETVLFICEPAALPGNLKVKDFISFIIGIAGDIDEDVKNGVLTGALMEKIGGKKIEGLTNEEKCDLLLDVMGMIKCGIYLIKNIEPNMTAEFASQFKARMETLARHGALVLYLTTDTAIRKYPKNDSILHFDNYWLGQVDNYKNEDDVLIK